MAGFFQKFYTGTTISICALPEYRCTHEQHKGSIQPPGMMDVQDFIEDVPTLSDLELAILLSLIAKEHCIVYADDDLLEALASELALIVSETFKLTYVVVEPQDLLSAERFGEAILDERHKFADDLEPDDDGDVLARTHSRIQSVSFKNGPRSLGEQNLDNRLVVNVVIAKDFNTAAADVQIQVLELIRRRRIYSRTTVHPAPKPFLFLPLVSTANKDVRLNHHLNDRIFMSHYHSREHGFPNLEEMEGVEEQGGPRQETAEGRLVIREEIIDQLHTFGKAVTLTPEIRGYMQDLVVFLRLERGVDGGITPYGNVCFVELAKYLAPLHGIDFVTPSLIDLAAKKVFPHRLTMAVSARDRSLQYGSSIDAVQHVLQGLTPEDVIESVLEKVDCPL